MRIAVIGGGAAGMMCAATINELSPETDVVLIERNDTLGKKVVISGGGRCNVTTGITDIKTALTKYPRGNKFLISAFNRFSPQAVFDWFENHGVPLKCEPDMRVFPQSDNGRDIVKAFEKIFAEHHTKVLTKQTVVRVEKNNPASKHKFSIHFKDQSPLLVDAVVIAVGGQAYRHTGSAGDGYTFAESLGHTVTPLAASLNSFITLEKWPKQLAGVSIPTATISAEREKKYSFTGSFLFTHAGITGPAVFALSSLVAFEEYNQKNPLQLFIDFVPDAPLPAFEKQFAKLIQTNQKKSFKNTIHTFVPMSVAEMICTQGNISLDMKNAEIRKTELLLAVYCLKRMPLHAIGRGAGDEFVTAGGVELTEVDPKTMESKKCPGLYFAGEVLNVDGFTGGFNLQASWAAGRAAGEAIATS